jgi:hypothetical protein
MDLDGVEISNCHLHTIPSFAAFYDDIFVGCVCGLLEVGTKKLYIPVIAVLAPYRDRGIGETVSSLRQIR